LPIRVNLQSPADIFCAK